MNKAIIQFQLAQNKIIIYNLENRIYTYRKLKSYSDEHGFVAAEKDAHNKLKVLRKELKKYVAAQKMLKAMMKGQM